jgi:hypothetical protein
MWSKIMDCGNGYEAETWRDVLNAEAVSVRIVPPLEAGISMLTPREIWVPDSKTHVAREVMRKV